MGTIDFAPQLETSSIMVPLALLLVLPLVAATGHDMDMDMMKNMMSMMEMMNKMKGWGDEKNEMQAPARQEESQWYQMENSADYEAYLKWCEENRARTAEFQQQSRLLEQFKEREAAKKEEARKMQVQMEAEEKKKNMMAEWKMWEKQMESVHEFDKLGYEIMEMKAKYYYMVTFEFMKMCKCNDFTSKVEAFFMGESSNSKALEMDDMFEDIVDITEEGLANNDPATVAQTLVRLSKGDQIKAFFAGLREVMCDGAEAYVEQVESWEKQYRFLERLM